MKIGIWTCLASLCALALGAAAASGAPPERVQLVRPDRAGFGPGLRMNAVGWEAVTSGRKVVAADFPLEAGRSADLELERFRVAGAQTRFVHAGADGVERPIHFDPESVVLLRGRVVGKPGSHVFLSFGAHGGAGRIELGAGAPSYVVTSRDAAGPDAAVRVMRAVGAATSLRVCGGAGASAAPTGTGPMGPVTDVPIRGLKQVQVAVDADHEYYQLFNDLNAATQYILQLYGADSDIFMRDCNLRLDLSFVRVWTGPDPYGPNPNFPQIPAGTVFDISQMLSGTRVSDYGGIASGNTSVSAYTLGFFVSPDRPHFYNQDIRITCHEMGHTLGGPHSHEIGLDQCHLGGPVPSRGCLLSYCPQSFTGGAALCDMWFRTAIRDRIRAHVTSRPNIVSDCNQNGIADPMDITSGFSADANANGVPDECEDCNGNGVLDPSDIASGLSLDLNGNGMPDECEPDCNENNVPDDRDIQLGTSSDLHGNGVPDECEADCNNNGQSDYSEIMADMGLDIDRDAVLDACQDCDANGKPNHVAVAGANNVWVASLSSGTIQEHHATSGVRLGASATPLGAPQDVLVTEGSRVLVSSGDTDRVVEFDADGVFVRDLVPPGSGGLDFPTGLLLTRAGHLLVAGRDTDSVLRYDAATGQSLGTLVASGAGGLVGPHGMVQTLDGRLLVTSDDNRVLEYDGHTGVFLRELVAAGAGTLLDPRGMLLLDDPPRLLVVSHGNDRVLQYDPATGASLGRFNYGDYAGEMHEPWGIVRGPDGGVYVSRQGNLRSAPPPQALHLTKPLIFHFDPRNGYLVRALIQGTDAQLVNPTGFGFLPRGGDCNLNLVPDECDIASGFSQDLNGNGVPDECESCYVDCDGDGALTLADFGCFQTRFALANVYADCNGDGSLNLADFGCFQTRFALGCP